MSSHAEPNRRVDLGKRTHDQRVLHVAEAGATVFLGHQDAEESQLTGLAEDLDGKTLGFVRLLDDGIDLFAREALRGLADGALFSAELEVYERVQCGGRRHRCSHPLPCRRMLSRQGGTCQGCRRGGLS